MNDFFIRSEDIEPSEFPNLYVETSYDREIIEKLKGKVPTVLVGSRGVGKSFLMHMAENELQSSLRDNKSLPVYLTFTKSSLITNSQKGAFHSWMMSKFCSATVKKLKKTGRLVSPMPELDLLSGGKFDSFQPLQIEHITSQFEDSWKDSTIIDISSIPTVDDFKDAIAEVCELCDLKRIVYFIDEAAHVFIREQQAEFFTLFRDLRCPHITCHAAVYPGVTAYGEIFQPKEDATFIHINRNISSSDYVDYMRQVVEKQDADSTLLRDISKYRENFANLAYAANGNPRHLLKTLSKLQKFQSAQINQVIKDFYKTEMLGEHSDLSKKYPSLEQLINWGRNFVEDSLLPEMTKRNNDALSADPQKATTCFFWIHQNAPESVLRSINLLEYTGLVQENTRSIRATRSEIGTRYSVNLGLLLANEPAPMTTAYQIIKSLDVRLMKEYGENSEVYSSIKDTIKALDDNDVAASVKKVMEKSIEVLDLSPKMISRLKDLSLVTIGDVVVSSEDKLMEAYYVGMKRSRKMKNIAMNAIYEYLIG